MALFAACNLPWLDFKFELAPEAGLDTGAMLPRECRVYYPVLVVISIMNKQVGTSPSLCMYGLTVCLHCLQLQDMHSFAYTKCTVCCFI